MFDHYLLEYSKPKRMALLNELRKLLYDEISMSLEGTPNIDRISVRVKNPESFAKKAVDPDTDPQYTDPLVEIEDQIAARVIVFFLEDIDVVKGKLCKTLIPVEQKHKKPSKDEEFGYESHHLICPIPINIKPQDWDDQKNLPPTIELQVRTIFMHAYAEPQHNWAYKTAEELPSEIKKQLAWIAASAWGADREYQRTWEWYVRQEGAISDN